MWTSWNWLVLCPSIQLTKKLKPSEFFSNFGFPSIWRASSQKRHNLSFNGCPVFSSNVTQLIVQFFNRNLGTNNVFGSPRYVFELNSKDIKFYQIVKTRLVHFFFCKRLDDVRFDDKIFFAFPNRLW